MTYPTPRETYALPRAMSESKGPLEMPVSDNKQLAASRASAANGKDPLLPKQPHSRRLHRAYRRAVEASTLSKPCGPNTKGSHFGGPTRRKQN